MYKLVNTIYLDGRKSIESVKRLSDNAFIPFDPANTDYVQFKTDIANGAELQDAEGNVMSQEQVNEFLATLP